MKKIIYFLAVLAVIVPLSNSFAAEKFTGVVNVNTASAEELMKIPGIGPSKAEAIIAFRQTHPFKAVSELVEVKGIGPKMLEKIQPFVTIDGTTPSASPAKPVASGGSTTPSRQ